MKNRIEIDGWKAVVSYDPEIAMLRGEFIGLAGGADFYAASVDGLREEGRLSLKTFLDMCREKGIEPRRSFSGRFNVRLAPEIHEKAVFAATAEGKSLNDWIVGAISAAAD